MDLFMQDCFFIPFPARLHYHCTQCFLYSRILKIKCFTISVSRVDKPSKDFSVHWQNQGHFIDSLPKEYRRKVTLVKHNSYNPFIHSSVTCSKIALRKWDWDCKWACSNQKTFLLQQYDSILASSERWCWNSAGSSKKIWILKYAMQRRKFDKYIQLVLLKIESQPYQISKFEK